MKPIRTIAIIIAISITGCMTVPQNKIEIKRYAIEPIGEFTSADTSLNLSLKIVPFTVDALYRGGRIIYRDETGGADYYYYHRWIAPPENQFADLLAANMMQWGLLADGVFQDDTGIIPTHEITCRLTALDAYNIRRANRAVLEINLSLTSIHPKTLRKSLIFQRQYSFATDRKDGNVPSFIAAVDTLAGQWLNAVRVDLQPIFLREAEKFIND